MGSFTSEEMKGVLAEAAKGYQLDMIKFLHESGFDLDSQVLEKAAQHGDFEVRRHTYYNLNFEYWREDLTRNR